jgi:beta-galactosidase
MRYGGDYYPEQWPEEVWADDVARMREAGVTMVTVGVFAWARLQPEPGAFDAEWLDRVLDLLHDAGIEVDLATATASPPPWLSAAHPGVLARDADGAAYWPGSRQHYAPTSPVYREASRDLVRRLAERYAHHPAVRLWHVNNEYACHLHYDYSESAAVAFRGWLRSRYADIDELNDAWGTWFWSQRFTSFDEISPPRRAPYSRNPGGLLDFKRFTSDALLELFLGEKEIIRAAGATQPVTTNFMGAFPVVDYRRWASHLDVISDDSYPDPADPESFRGAAFTRDLMRSLKPDTPWLLMEQATSAVSWRGANAPKAPGQMAALSMQAVGRGADGIFFFQWRQSRRGSERFHSAMLPIAGTSTRVWREVVQLGADLSALPELPPAAPAPVALVFDWEAWWAIAGPDHPVVLDYAAVAQRWHAALHRMQVPVDIVHPAQDLSAYRIVIASLPYLLSPDAVAALDAFVRGGGTLLVAGFGDVADEHDGFHAEGFTAQLAPLLGARVVEHGGLVPPPPAFELKEPDDVAERLAAAAARPGRREVTVAFSDGRSLTGQYLEEELEVRDAEVLATYADGPLAGKPALTSRGSGAGRALYLATVPDDAGMSSIVAELLDAAGVRAPLDVADQRIEVSQRGDVLTIINHSADQVEVRVTGTDAVTGEVVDDVRLGAFEWRMVRGVRPA